MSGKQIGRATLNNPFLFRWNAHEPEWIQRDCTEANLFGPLYENCQEAYVYCVEWQRDTPRAMQARDFLVVNAESLADGGYRYREPARVVSEPRAPLLWGYDSQAFRLCNLLLFDAANLPLVLRALSHLAIVMSTVPFMRTGNWKDRERRARQHVRDGGLALNMVFDDFCLEFPIAYAQEVTAAMRLIEKRWESYQGGPGDLWRPPYLYGDALPPPTQPPGAQRVPHLSEEEFQSAPIYCGIQEFREALSARGLAQHTEMLLGRSGRALGLLPTPLPDDAQCSCFGAAPIMSAAVPTWQGRPLKPVLQINCQNLAGLEAARELPHEGWLHLWFDNEEQAWGSSPEEGDALRLIYQPAEEAVGGQSSALASADGEEDFHPQGMKMLPLVEVPDEPRPALLAAGMTTEEAGRYAELYDELARREPSPPDHRLLGKAEADRGTMLEYCIAGYAAKHAGRSTSPEEWRLLLRIDSDDELGYVWGDCGVLYVWIREADLAARNFADVWAVMISG